MSKIGKYIILVYDEDSPEFISLGVYETLYEAHHIVFETKDLYSKKHFIIAEIQMDVYYA